MYSDGKWRPAIVVEKLCEPRSYHVETKWAYMLDVTDDGERNLEPEEKKQK